MSKQIQIDTICKTESKDTVAGHNSLLHGWRRDFCVDQYYIVDNQDYSNYNDDHFYIVPYFMPDFHIIYSPLRVPLSGFFETDKAKEP